MSASHSSAVALPSLCAELKLHAAGGVALVNSRDVAEMFEKQHQHVLRDIDDILQRPNLDAASWFRATDFRDTNGRSRRSFDITRQGFALLVMGWTGDRAMEFKFRYIEAFDEMEAALRSGNHVTADQLMGAIREIVAPLAVRFDYQDQSIARVEGRVESIASDVAQLKARVLSGRRNLTAQTKAEHIDAVKLLGGRCPCCGTADIIVNGERGRFAEFDHFYCSSRPDVNHTWLICKPCHADLTTGRFSRDQREAVFRAYQDRRLRLPGRQRALALFG